MFGDELKRLRKKCGLNQYELGEAVDMSQATIASWENGTRKPDYNMIVRLSEVLGVSTDELLGLRSKAHLSGVVRIPVLGTIRAGVPLDAIEEILDYEEIPADWTRGDKEFFALRVTGDSMSPVYLDGDTIILRKQDTCDSGQDCAVMVDDEDATFKRVKWSPRGVTLQALNPDYEPLFFTSAEWRNNGGRVLGVVVELRRKIS